MNIASHNKLAQSGFTMTELITVMVIMGVLAAAAAPRFFDRGTFDSRGFYDQTISTLRYAQKTAIAQHRYVCAVFTANSVMLTMGATAACGSNLTDPTGTTPYLISSSNVTFTSAPAALSFDALGKPYDAAGVALTANRVITVNGYASSITVEQETGYVH